MSVATTTRGSYRSRLLRDYVLAIPNAEEQFKSFEIQEPKAPIRREFLKDIDPDMFVPGYQRWCPKGPTILETQAQMDEAKEAGRDVMIFPLNESEGIPRAYVCDDSSFRYVGLRYNKKLRNKDAYPILPCCFKEPQTDPSEPTLRYQYEHPEEEIEEKDERGRPKILSSQKIMKRDVYARLPDDIVNFLKAINPDSEALPLKEGRHSFVRQGTIHGINSVLDALIQTMIDYHDDIEDVEDDDGNIINSARELKDQYQKFISDQFPVLLQAFKNYDFMESETRDEYLYKVRVALAEFVSSNITSQSSFAVELRTLRETIIKNENYLDPRIVWRILEEAFHVDIILFRRTQDQPEGFLGSPIFLQEYLQYKRSKKSSKYRYTVMLFETIGTERDTLTYPQVEIVKNFRFTTTKTGELTTHIFSWFDKEKDHELLTRIHKAIDELYGWDGHSSWHLPNVFISKPQAQCSDFYGKIRYIQFGDDVCILTEPLPPMDKADLITSENNKCHLIPIPVNKARSFLNIEGLQEGIDYKPSIVGGKIVGYLCWKKTKIQSKPLIRFYLPIIPMPISGETNISNTTKKTPSITALSTSTLAPSFIANGSLMENFNQMSRLARYIIEYVLWIFSSWHKEQNGDIKNPKYIAEFAKSKFQIQSNHQYPNSIPRRLDKSLSGIVSPNGSILVSNYEVRNRLVYALQIRITQDPIEVVEYWSRIYIKNYYQDITDFDLQESNIILFGSEMVLNWIQSKMPHYVLYDRIQFNPCSEKDAPEADNENKSEKKDDTQNDKQIEKNEQIKECKTLQKMGFIIDPYFMRLEYLDNKIYIVQQAQSLAHALYLCETWFMRGYNAGYGSDGIISTTTPFRYISYNGPLDMTVEMINGNEGQYTILQYRYKKQIWTMALLPYDNKL